MKKQILVAGAALMALAVPVIAAQHDGGGSHAMKPDMTRAEVEAKVKERFTMIDANKDGAITVEEVKAHKEARHKQRADAHFKMMDGNGDGSISRAEFDAGHAAMRDGMTGGKGDRGHGPMMGGGHHGMAMKMGERMFEKADANKDGKVTLAEASSAALAHFDKADADKNGTVTSQERMNYWKSQKGDWNDEKAAS